MARTARQRVGSDAEDRAAACIEAAGLAIIARNWRCRAGELDIVAREPGPAGTLVFVEVRARASNAFGGARASVTPAKQARLVRAAELFRLITHNDHRPCRFDVIAIEDGALDWIRDAFQVEA
jgi:putative endonuclease